MTTINLTQAMLGKLQVALIVNETPRTSMSWTADDLLTAEGEKVFRPGDKALWEFWDLVRQALHDAQSVAEGAAVAAA